MSDTKSKRFKIPKTYKTILALLAVTGPITWLSFTDEGQRRSDLMILAFKGDPFVEMRLDTLASAATEENVREFLPEVQWQCKDKPNPFGQRSCISPIGAFNDIPAYYMVLYFDQEALQAMKVAYRGGYHDYLMTQTGSMLGTPEPGPGGVLQWPTEGGLVLIPKQIDDNKEAALMWLSAERALALGKS